MASTDLVSVAAARYGWDETEDDQTGRMIYTSGEARVVIMFDAAGRIRWAEAAGYRIDGGVNGVIEVFRAFSR